MAVKVKRLTTQGSSASQLHENYDELWTAVVEQRKDSWEDANGHLDRFSGTSVLQLSCLRTWIRELMKHWKTVHIALGSASTWVNAGGGPG